MYNSQNLPLSPKKIIKKTIARSIRWLLPWFLPGLIAILIFSSTLGKLRGELGVQAMSPIMRQITRIWLVSLIFYVISILIYEYFYYKLYFYDFAEDKAVIRKGVISRATGYVRYERLQNIYVDQDILDRIFGLYDVHYETAGEVSGFYSHVDGLNKENTDKLVAFLEEKAKQPISSSRESEEIPQPEVSLGDTETGEISIREYPLSKAVIIERTIGWVIILFIPYFFIFRGIGAWLIGFVGILVLSLIYNWVWYENFYFHFGQEKGEIKSKVIGQSISYLYYDRIQNVNLSQSVLDRLFGIYTIAIETAGEKAWMKLVIDGLPKEGAEKVKDFLLEKAKYYRGRL